MPLIVVCGEALIDLRWAARAVYEAKLGGGPFNTAIAAARLGASVGYFGRLSEDRFGQRLRTALLESGVDVSLARRGREATALAVVHLDQQGDAAYTFYVADTADRLLDVADLPALPDEAGILHFGTLSLVLEPGATAYEALMARAADRLVVIDPNVRAELIPDRRTYLPRFEGWCRLAGVVRVSTADAAWLYSGRTAQQVGERLLDLGVALAIVTDGGLGATAMSTSAGVVTVPAPQVNVVDTIGAGDTFNGALLVWLDEHDRGDLLSVAELDAGDLEELLHFANSAAAVTCGRAGADPPWRRELAGPRGATLR